MSRDKDPTGRAGDRKFFTIPNLTEHLDVSTRTVRRWTESGDLVAHRFGGVVRIAEGDLPVILSGAAIAVLESIPRAGDYVIAGLRPENARHDLKRPWEAIRHRAALGPIRLHDLRHTFAATGAGSNLGLPVIGKLLGHKRAETTSRYAHIATDPPKTAADAIASKLAAKMGEAVIAAKDGSKVIESDFKRRST
jgi:excisionase family DNA binding protein